MITSNLCILGAATGWLKIKTFEHVAAVTLSFRMIWIVRSYCRCLMLIVNKTAF